MKTKYFLITSLIMMNFSGLYAQDVSFLDCAKSNGLVTQVSKYNADFEVVGYFTSVSFWEGEQTFIFQFEFVDKNGNDVQSQCSVNNYDEHQRGCTPWPANVNPVEFSENFDPYDTDSYWVRKEMGFYTIDYLEGMGIEGGNDQPQKIRWCIIHEKTMSLED